METSELLEKKLSVDESAAGTFREIEIEMPSNPMQNQGYIIKGVEFIQDNPKDKVANGNIADLAICTDEKSSMPTAEDREVIAYQRKVSFGDAVPAEFNAIITQKTGLNGKMLSDKDAFKTMLDTLYAHVDSANTGTVHTSEAVIYYKIAQFSDREADDIQMRDTYLRQ
ncbi:MAG: hypothetical protein KJO12_10210 [Ignavibacteria bacterium]|nr:hypothetical protein [Ignavibacteria bacterium]